MEKWKPKYMQRYWYVYVNNDGVKCYSFLWRGDIADNGYYENNNCFETEKEVVKLGEQINKLFQKNMRGGIK